MDMRELQERIHEWSDRTFPAQSGLRLTAHLTEEVQELHQAVASESKAGIADNIADCAILVAEIASHYGFDLAEAVRIKHVVNTTRTFAYDPTKGYDKHIDEPRPKADGGGGRKRREQMTAPAVGEEG